MNGFDTVFVPYRGFYFLNTGKFFNPIKKSKFVVFVPYRGFYFLNDKMVIDYERGAL